MSNPQTREGTGADRIMAALSTLPLHEQKLFEKALDRHNEGECSLEQAIADFIAEVHTARGTALN